eukprot:CAMPEP_0113515328 /NCGR_PEP_ID=MMETSP0014_2-20120614/40882_1 /TAXON_ID=2857 /ORGANISM="Nitzschia sp." /LENGTH=388 /DNA_ID=CAMNT_0000411881 /DNA_START=55 /DNA_END=1218 /DNA_ORIENTATION=+ /assembly_acc=CAM_ASM_000159
MIFHLLLILILQLLFVTGMAWGQSVNVAVDNLSSSVSSCPNHGCPMFPMDIVNDQEAKDALTILASKDDQQQQQKQALETLKGSGDELKVVLTLTGFKGGPVPNQDAAVILSPLKILTNPESGDDEGKEDKKKNSSSTNDIIQLIGVFDGHGTDGELTSNFATKEIPKRLSERLSSVMSSSSSVTSTPDTTVIEILKQVFIEVDKLDPSGGRGGCTATLVLQLGSKVFVANAGDSVSFVGVATSTNSNKKQKIKKKVDVEVIYQTREDKPDLPEERKRIHEAGGYVHIPEDPNHDVPRAYNIDEYGRARYGLAMSRSLGDWSVQGVIAEPIVDVIDLQQIQTSYLESCRLSSSSSKESNKQEKCDSMDPDSIRFFAVSMSDGMADYLE